MYGQVQPAFGKQPVQGYGQAPFNQPMMGPAPGQPPMYGQPGFIPQQPGPSHINDEMAELKAQLSQMKAEQDKMKEDQAYKEIYKKLPLLEGVFIRQKVDLVEVLTGCNNENKYEIFPLVNNQKKEGAHPQFIFKEKSSCYSRTCLSADCRPLDMRVLNFQKNGDDAGPCLHIVRPCKLTIACCNRQEMQVQWIEKGEQAYIGKILEPWVCCNYEVYLNYQVPHPR